MLYAGSPTASGLQQASILLQQPLVLVGTRDEFLALDAIVQTAAREYLVDPWELDEALLRLSLALARAERPVVEPSTLLLPRRGKLQHG